MGKTLADFNEVFPSTIHAKYTVATEIYMHTYIHAHTHKT